MDDATEESSDRFSASNDEDLMVPRLRQRPPQPDCSPEVGSFSGLDSEFAE